MKSESKLQNSAQYGSIFVKRDASITPATHAYTILEVREGLETKPNKTSQAKLN